jgi:hypothetical protein
MRRTFTSLSVVLRVATSDSNLTAAKHIREGKGSRLKMSDEEALIEPHVERIPY